MRWNYGGTCYLNAATKGPLGSTCTPEASNLRRCGHCHCAWSYSVGDAVPDDHTEGRLRRGPHPMGRNRKTRTLLRCTTNRPRPPGFPLVRAPRGAQLPTLQAHWHSDEIDPPSLQRARTRILIESPICGSRIDRIGRFHPCSEFATAIIQLYPWMVGTFR